VTALSEARPTDAVILKILSGVQSGVEVALVPGEYGLGGGPDDDIQVIDVTVKPGHARLRVSGGKIEVRGDKGALRSAVGLQLEPGGEWQEVEPLDVLTAGTTRFALGHPTSQWSTIVEADGSAPPRPAPARSALDLAATARSLAVPLLALVLLLGFAVWYVLGGAARLGLGGSGIRDDVQVVRAALDEFPFGRPVAVRQEVDGALFVSGYVETPVERRALAGAVERTGAPARMRLWVLQTIRTEVANLVASQRLPVTFALSQAGELTLEGTVLNEGTANRFVELVRDRVLGVTRVESRIRTAAVLLGEVERLAVATGVGPLVIFRVDNELIEANGAIPNEKVDAWVGFLQSYARRFSREIPLRSFVQLQSAGARGAPGRPIMIGGQAEGGDAALDLDRLRTGAYRLDDIFAGGVPEGAQAQGQASGRAQGQAGRAGPARGGQGASGQGGAQEGATQPGGAPADASRFSNLLVDLLGEARRIASPGEGAPMPAAGGAQGSGSGGAPGELAAQARQLLERWRSGQLGSDPLGRALQAALDAQKTGEGVPSWYVPLLSDRPPAETGRCWAESGLHPEDLVPILFWLDMLSAADTVSMTGFGRDTQLAMLEVALNPGRIAACAARRPEAQAAAANSLYLREIGRNPAFIRFLVRDLPPFTLEIAGADLGQPRSVLTRGGRRMREGAAPDRTSRLALIGELGVVVQLRTALAAVAFDPDINWKSQ
jgi:hypothetical protein